MGPSNNFTFMIYQQPESTPLLSTARRIIKNTSSLLVAQGISYLLGFTVVVYLARVLGPGDFGKINFALAIIAYFTLITNMGLPLLGAREIAREREKVKEYVSNILILRLCLALFGFGLLLFLVFLMDKPQDVKYLLMLYGFGLIPSALLLDWTFQGMEKMEYIGIGRIVSSVISAGLILGFVKGPERLLLIPFFQVSSNLFAAGLFIFLFLKCFGKLRLEFRPSLWKEFIRLALPIGLSIFMIQIYYNADTVMLGFMRSNDEVGYYNAAYKIIMVLILAGGAYHETIFPLISSYYKKSLDPLRYLLSFTARLMTTLSLPIAVGGTILARPIMKLLYGSTYDGGIMAFQILIWVIPIIWINTIYSRGLLGCDKQNYYLIGVSIAAITNITVNLFLIPFLGLLGAAIATVVAEGFALAVFYIKFMQITHIPFAQHSLRPLLASLVMASFLLWGLNGVNLNLFILIFGAIAIYFLFLFLVNGITKEDIIIMLNVLNARKLQ